jgi:hypothetical protein
MKQETVKVIKDNKPRLTEYEVEPTLEEAQKVVGGYVELVDLDGLGCLLVDEEGRLKRKPINEQATKLYNQLFDGVIVGDAILIKPENRKDW